MKGWIKQGLVPRQRSSGKSDHEFHGSLKSVWLGGLYNPGALLMALRHEKAVLEKRAVDEVVDQCFNHCLLVCFASICHSNVSEFHTYHTARAQLPSTECTAYPPILLLIQELFQSELFSLCIITHSNLLQAQL